MIDVSKPSAETVTRQGYLSQEVIDRAEAAGTWVKRDGRPVWTVCGDERSVDEASAADFAARKPEAMNPAEGGMGVFGQVPAMAKHVAVVGIATHGEDFLDKMGGFDGLVDKLSRFMGADKSALAVLPALHTSADKERAAFDEAGEPAPETTAAFCSGGHGATGCAYCGNIGLASHLVGENSDMQALGRENVESVTGNDDGVDALIAAHKAVAGRLGQDYQFTRQKYVDSKLPTMVLAGKPHAAAAKTGVLINMNPDEIGKMGDFYRMDVAAAALAIRRALPEIDLPADLLIKSMILDAVPVRAVLASHDVSGDHTADPRRLAIGVRGGTMNQALARIAELEIA